MVQMILASIRHHNYAACYYIDLSLKPLLCLGGVVFGYMITTTLLSRWQKMVNKRDKEEEIFETIWSWIRVGNWRVGAKGDLLYIVTNTDLITKDIPTDIQKYEDIYYLSDIHAGRFISYIERCHIGDIYTFETSNHKAISNTRI